MEVEMPLLKFTLLLVMSTSLVAQEKDKWKRVYTYEDSVVEINAAKVLLVDNNIARVVFRTVWSKPVTIREKPGVKYKTRLETIECKCAERRYRIYKVTLIDSKGKPVDSYEMEENEEWKTAKPGGMMERLMESGCRLVLEK